MFVYFGDSYELTKEVCDITTQNNDDETALCCTHYRKRWTKRTYFGLVRKTCHTASVDHT